MNGSRLPIKINPLRMVQERRTLAGSLPIAAMSRLVKIVTNNSGTVELELAFDLDQENRPLITGKLKAQLELECQRCLKPFKYQVDSEFSLVPVTTTEQAKALPSRYDPLMLTDDEILLSDLVEDELLLNLPIIAKHIPEDCPANKKRASKPKSVEKKGFQKEHPFAKLAQLKRR